MLEIIPGTTLICLFTNDASAAAAVHDLLALRLNESDIAVVGDARTELTGKVLTDTLSNTFIPDESLAHLTEGLADGGTIVVVRATGSLAEEVDAIFRRHSATETHHFSHDPGNTFEEPNRLDMIESQ
jgi:hypothetical protein